MRIAHLSDLHIRSKHADMPILADMRADLTRAVDDILTARPDLVLLTGDLYGRAVPHRPTPAEREVLEPQLIRLAEAAPVLVLPGNHDHDASLQLLEGLGGTYPVSVLNRAGHRIVITPAGPARVYWLAYPTKRWLLANAPSTGVVGARAAAMDRVRGLLTAWAGQMQHQKTEAPEVPILFLGHFQVRGSRLSSGEVLATGEIEVSPHDLAALPVDYGALGHVHERQSPVPGWFYSGSPWSTDFGETGTRGWHLVQVKSGDARCSFQDVGARPWLTLDYRWSSDREGGEPRWIERPTDEQLDAVSGAVVRARLVVPDIHATSCPWDAELERLRAIAHRVQAERRIEATTRVRAPEVASAKTHLDRMRVWWGTLASPPEDQDREAAVDALAELEQLEDEQIGATTRELLTAARP